ncbi:UDP-galactopyranose mutase [Mycoplasmopsis alligatoris]|uniref:UDP-galactopyranose mutase n=1 Tax=Mycoplasmopsis alligatoris A21JP2 TaxID=747682 RepID=D4XW62_9BACT|nr:UDP-galactopyranose mutase [Mycoplasmopsis alligatoris]EFF41427.1 UDP-galactopyranose mutase [Mycoplasmopsis alligatoris A21JP2]
MKIKIIGTGIAGCSIANLFANEGYEVDIYEKKNHIGGNCYDLESKSGILYHLYGPHIFHTKNLEVAKFVQKFAKFNSYVNKPVAKIRNKFINLPISFTSIKQIVPNKYERIINQILKEFPNSQEVSIYDLKSRIKDKETKKIVDWIYQNVYASYTSKMWNIKIDKIDKDVLNRVKILLNEQHNYFPGAILQGLPEQGYTKMLEKMLDHPNIKLHLNFDAMQNLELKNNTIYWDKVPCNNKIIYTGQIENLLKFKHGYLPYRSLNFKFLEFDKSNYQNYTIINKPLHKSITRTVEYKKMTLQKHTKTLISHEYPGQYNHLDPKWNVPYYPINQDNNIKLYNLYKEEIVEYKNMFLLGRLAQYKYFDMDKTIEEAIELFNSLTRKFKAV